MFKRAPLLCFCFLLCGALPAFAQTSDRPLAISLPAGDLAEALDKLGDQSGVQIMYEPALAKGIVVAAVSGTLSVRDALTKLLAQTGLQADRVNDNTFVLQQVQGRPSATAAPAAQSLTTRVADHSAATGDEVQEVVVTARLRNERLQDVPASIVAASGQTIADLNIVSATELSSIAPGLTFVTDPGRFGSGPAISIRGISTFTQSPAIQDSVSIVLDGIPVSRAKGGSFPDLTDVEQIEVLRGPQGTLFGKNSSAGVINVTTKDPTATPTGNAALDYSTYNNLTMHASVSGPILDTTLLGLVSVYSKERNGFIDDVYNNTTWGDDAQKGVRVKLLYAPTPADKVKLSGDFLQENNDAGTETVRAFLSNTPQYIVSTLAPLVGTENDKIDARTVDSNGQQSSNVQRSGGLALQWDHSMGGHRLTAITGYRMFTQNSNSGTYGWLTPLADGNTFFNFGTQQYSGELRLSSPDDGRLRYVAGLFAYYDKVTSGLYDPDPGLLALSATGVPNPVRQQRNWVNDTRSLNYAAFGEADFDLTSQLTLTAGVRGTHEHDEVTIDGLPITLGNQRVVVPLGVTRDSASANKPTWRVGAQWRFDADRMVYVSAAKGFKGPGFNAVSGILGNAQMVRPETSTSFEAGLKSQFLNRRLTANLTGFYATYDDFQTQGFSRVPGTEIAQVIIANAAKLKTQGVEAEFAAHVTGATTITANATFIDATFDSFPGAQCYATQPVGPGQCFNGQQDLTGERLANTPKWAFNVAGRHDFPVAGVSWSGFVTADYSWRSNVQWDVLQNPLAIEGSYGLLGASLGTQSPDGKYFVKVYGKNLTDRFHTEGLLVGTAVTQFLPVDYRRVIGINAGVNF